MAINVNTVYSTVLLLLNQEQRGYMTPTEFNSIATQVQLEIFEKYSQDLNQQLRVEQTDADYANRIASITEKMAVFKTLGFGVYNADAGGSPARPYFTVPSNLYKIGTVAWNANNAAFPAEVEELTANAFYNIQKSDLTTPTQTYPVYLNEGNKLFVAPSTIVAPPMPSSINLEINYLRVPVSPKWNFTVGGLGQYLFVEPTAANNPSINFELMPSEQTTVILKILFYAGLVIEDPTVIQVAAQQVQSQEVNKKS